MKEEKNIEDIKYTKELNDMEVQTDQIKSDTF
jgi:hypothetical protein